jgi:hypothetical protein
MMRVQNRPSRFGPGADRRHGRRADDHASFNRDPTETAEEVTKRSVLANVSTYFPSQLPIEMNRAIRT